MYSYSRINTYEQCPRLYYDRYVLQVEEIASQALNTGNLFHIGMHAHNNGCDGIEAIQQAVVGDMNATKAIAALEVVIPVNPTLVATELMVERGNLHGVVDGLAIEDDELWTVEYKTGNPNKEFLMLRGWQAPLYAWLTGAVGTIFVLVNTSVQNIKARHVKVESMRWTHAALYATIELAQCWIDCIERDRLFLPRRTYNCNWCGFSHRCDVTLGGGSV